MWGYPAASCQLLLFLTFWWLSSWSSLLFRWIFLLKFFFLSDMVHCWLRWTVVLLWSGDCLRQCHYHLASGFCQCRNFVSGFWVFLIVMSYWWKPRMRSINFTKQSRKPPQNMDCKQPPLTYLEPSTTSAGTIHNTQETCKTLLLLLPQKDDPQQLVQ